MTLQSNNCFWFLLTLYIKYVINYLVVIRFYNSWGDGFCFLLIVIFVISSCRSFSITTQYWNIHDAYSLLIFVTHTINFSYPQIISDCYHFVITVEQFFTNLWQASYLQCLVQIFTALPCSGGVSVSSVPTSRQQCHRRQPQKHPTRHRCPPRDATVLALLALLGPRRFPHLFLNSVAVFHLTRGHIHAQVHVLDDFVRVEQHHAIPERLNGPEVVRQRMSLLVLERTERLDLELWMKHCFFFVCNERKEKNSIKETWMKQIETAAAAAENDGDRKFYTWCDGQAENCYK